MAKRAKRFDEATINLAKVMIRVGYRDSDDEASIPIVEFLDHEKFRTLLREKFGVSRRAMSDDEWHGRLFWDIEANQRWYLREEGYHGRQINRF